MKTLEALVNSWCPIFDDKESLWGQMGQITIHMSWVRGFGNISSSGMAMLFRVASERLKNARHAHIQHPIPRLTDDLSLHFLQTLGALDSRVLLQGKMRNGSKGYLDGHLDGPLS